MKTPLQSRTIWFALAVTVLGAWDQISPFIPAEHMAKIITIIGPIIAILRIITKEPIKSKTPE
jgi:RsiW-degrading membrane proteinase PrsW (M82 family)